MFKTKAAISVIKCILRKIVKLYQHESEIICIIANLHNIKVTLTYKKGPIIYSPVPNMKISRISINNENLI